MDTQHYDNLTSWKQENGIGGTIKFEGGSEYDYTAEAIKAYNEEEERKEKRKEKTEKTKDR